MDDQLHMQVRVLSDAIITPLDTISLLKRTINPWNPSQKNAPPRLMRILLRIQKYDFTVKYVPGKDIPIADGLSRLPIHGEEMPDINVTIHDITGVSESRLEKIKEVTKCEETLQVLTITVTNGWPQYRNQWMAAIQEPMDGRNTRTNVQKTLHLSGTSEIRLWCTMEYF